MSKLRLILLGVLAVFAASAAVSASASALQYYDKASGALIQGHLLVDGLGETQILKGKAFGSGITITCSHLDTHGTVTNLTNPASTVQSLLYLGCVVSGAVFAGCLVPEMMITTNVMGVLIGTVAAPSVEFLPPNGAGTTFVKIILEKCNTTELNKEYSIEGSALGKINNETSSVSINEAEAGSMLKFAGNAAGLTGETKVEMTGGGLILVK